MVHQATLFSDAQAAWQQWNLSGAEMRFQTVGEFKSALVSLHTVVAKVVAFHLKHARPYLTKVHELVGPTGETNQLYTAGRGVSLIVIEAECDNNEHALYSTFALLTSALLAGNSVVVCSDNAELNALLEKALSDTNFPTHLVQLTSYDAATPLLSCDVRVLGYVGTPQVEQDFNRSLAKRSGVIVSLVSETDLNHITVAHDPHLSLRFMTERTRSINITAVGGNATLLELGSESH